jgi:hypothetical protein
VTVTGNSSTWRPPRPSLTRSRTTYVPGVVYSNIAWSPYDGAPPAPNSQATATTSSSGSDALAVACTTCGAGPDSGSTTGSAVGDPLSSAGTTTIVPAIIGPCSEHS